MCVSPLGNNSDGSMPVEEACNVLVKNNISSAPVYEKNEAGATEYEGMFDYGDVIAYLLLVLLEQVPEHLQQEETTMEITDIVRRAMKGQSVPVRLTSGNSFSERQDGVWV